MNALGENIHSLKSPSQENRIMAQKLVVEAKSCASDGELYKSLRLFQKAYKLFPTEKIQSRIQRIKEAIEEDEEEDENFGFIELDNGLVIFKKLVERLYPHQIEGVKWLYDLFRGKKKGGILADDMGLGKTIQIISFISAMFDMQLIKNILLVLPLSVIPTWLKEFENWAPGIKIECFHGPASKRMGILRQCMMKRSVCITTYGLIITQWQALSETIHGREFVWDYVILDEGHKIKRPSKTTKRLHAIPSKNRIILTGTPIQNRVLDMWALIDWVTQGSLLGTQRTFRNSYEGPIERARQKDATAPEIQLGNHMAESLRKLTQPYILRRTKSELMMEDKENMVELKKLADKNQDKDVISEQPSFPKLCAKNDFVVWVYLSPTQAKIYRDFVQLESVKDLLSSHRSPLVYLTVLKKLCDHPRLLSTKACTELGLQRNSNASSDDLDSQEYEDCAANRIDNISDDTLIHESGKLEFLIQLLLRLREEGHRTVVFSLSRKMLNIIQRILLNHKFKVMRLDGLVTKLKEREKRVNLFQKDESYNVFLLTTQVGGVGLTLTGADRAIIYDPSWNPATDAQSVDRIYRIGQKKRVVVYRLITCGTVEEKIYRRQVYKNSFIEQSTCGHKDPYRYFSRQDLAELFILDDPKSSATQQQLEKLHAHQRNFDAMLREHVNHLHTLKMFGLSDHDLMFSRKPDDFDYETEMAGNDFNYKVQEAQNRLKIESDQLTGFNEAELRWGAIAAGPRVTNVNKTSEPVYPIEGLSTRMDELSLPFKTELGASSSDESDRASSLERGYGASGSSGADANASEDSDKNEIKRMFVGKEEKTNASHTLPLADDSRLSPKLTPSSSKDITPENKLNLRLPSFDNDDDDLLLIADSPSFAHPKDSTEPSNSTFLSNNEVSSDDELILAVDSPLLQNNNSKPRIKITDASKDSRFPTEVQDSFTIFSDSGSEDLDDSWKKAFSRTSPVVANTSKELSENNTPLHAPIRRTRRIIESDDSEDDNLLQLRNISIRSNDSGQFRRNSSLSQSLNRASSSRLSTALSSRNSSFNTNSQQNHDLSDISYDNDGTPIDDSNKSDDTDLDENIRNKNDDISVSESISKNSDDTDLDDTQECDVNHSALNSVHDDLSQFNVSSRSTDQPFSLRLSDFDDEI